MNTRLISLAALVATLTACSSVPDRNAELDKAQGRFNMADRDPQVFTLAAPELKQAKESLALAQQAFSAGDKLTTVNHLAYLASQRVTIAQETASSRAAQAITAGAGAERDQMRLAMRTNEADMAKRQLALSEQRNAQKTSELAQADATALRDQTRLQMKDARLNDLEAQLKEMNVKKTERGIVVTLGDVLFDSGKAQLMPDGSENMAKLAGIFRNNPQHTASIEGYTDNVGGANANYDLSSLRAKAVMNALISLGVSPQRLSTRAHGEENPASSNSTSAGRQMNRRVEIVFAPHSGDLSAK